MKAMSLTTSESLMLDIIRVAAAMVVALAHITQPYFSTGWPDLTRYAEGAVAIFFVLSGFVIRHVTTRRTATLSHYLNDRLSRIYSVAIPALAFTVGVLFISRRANPSFYAPWLFKHPLSLILQNLVFCGQLWDRHRDPLSNLPYWSINYEFAYYLAYGCFFYLAGARRWISLAVICAFFGYHVLYLSPLWIAGCLIHDLYQKGATGPGATPFLRRFIPLFCTCVVCLPGLYLLSDRWYFLAAPFGTKFHSPIEQFLRSQGILPSAYLFGILWTVLFMGLLFFSRKFAIARSSDLARSIRFISDGTFPIYLFHFPLYVLIAACIPYNHGNPWAKILIFLAAVFFGIAAGPACNLLKDKLRSISIFSGHTLENPIAVPE
jgi:peptidoglycan/LPS O-acetylase OafA/YrhL